MTALPTYLQRLSNNSSIANASVRRRKPNTTTTTNNNNNKNTISGNSKRERCLVEALTCPMTARYGCA